MNYELAKKLKDAGFLSVQAAWNDTLKEVLPVPTLSELIEACGYDFRQLTYHSPRTAESKGCKYQAKGGKSKLGVWTLKNGNTPEEAVAKLYLALNKK